MRVQRQHRPSKRALESMESAMTASLVSPAAATARKRRKANGCKARNTEDGKQVKQKKKEKTATEIVIKEEEVKGKRKQGQSKKDTPSSFAEYIDQVLEVQTMAHQSDVNVRVRYTEPKSLKLQRQMRLIDLDVQSSSSDESEANLFDNCKIPDTFDDDSDLVVANGSSTYSSTKTSCLHSRTSSSSSVFDRQWSCSAKFHSEIPISHAQTGSERVDNIVKQYHNIEQFDDNFFSNKYESDYTRLNDDNNDCIYDNNNDEINNDDDTNNDNDNNNNRSLTNSGSQLTSLNLRFLKRNPSSAKADNLLLSPTSSFNMLTGAHHKNFQMTPIVPIQREPSSCSLASTNVNLPGSPTLDLEESNDLPQPGPYEDSLAKYVNIECDSSHNNAALLSVPPLDHPAGFSFEYRHNNSCLNLSKSQIHLDSKPTTALHKRAIWAGRECEMINGEVDFDDFLL